MRTRSLTTPASVAERRAFGWVIAASFGVACGGRATDGVEPSPSGSNATPAASPAPPFNAPPPVDVAPAPRAAASSLRGGPPVLLDVALAMLAADLASVPLEAQRFMRYLSLWHLKNPEASVSLPGAAPSDGDVPEDAPERRLDVRRLAVLELANSVSFEPGQSIPELVGAERLFQRLDLRAYGWDRPIDVDGRPYADGWEAIVAHASLAVEYAGPEANRLRELSGSRIPWLLSDDFVANVATGNLYYELLGLPSELRALQARLEGPAVEGAAGAEASVYRAGFGDSGVSFSPRVVEWRPALEGGGYWQALDFASDASASAVITAPLTFVPDATEVIFTLPNGLRGYFTADGAGQRVAVSPLSGGAISDPAQRDAVMRNAASCFGCHNAGLIPFCGCAAGSNRFGRGRQRRLRAQPRAARRGARALSGAQRAGAAQEG